MARTAERGKLDCMFFQDSVAIPGSTAVYGGQPFRVKSGRQAHIEPMTAIAAIGAITKRLGLISTCTTSYNEPYNVARRFLTIDHISGGRAGWNLVTSQAEDEAVNFGRDQHFEHGIRYDRASEFHDVVVGLWDSWEDDAFLRDKAIGRLVRLRQDAHPQSPGGVLQRARTAQRRALAAGPAGGGAGGLVGRRHGARCAHRRPGLHRAGHDPRGPRLPRRHASRAWRSTAAGPTRSASSRASSRSSAAPCPRRRSYYEELRALVDDGVGIAAVARLAGGVDIFSMDPDGPLPPLKPSNAARARQERIIAMGKRGMTIREIGRVLAMSQTHRVIWGTPKSIADDLHEWLEAGAADGFNLLFAHYPKPLEEWVDHGDPRAAAARPVPHRVREHDLPRQSRRADPEEPVPQEPDERAGPGRGGVQ